jgi:mRNA interferase MazF
MGAFASRQIILLPFPFSDLSAQKLRPALILANAGRGDWLLCQITSKPYTDSAAVELTQNSFAVGSLQRISYARPSKLFTAHESLFHGTAGSLELDAHLSVVAAVVAIIQKG